jgi:hypothetical protein
MSNLEVAKFSQIYSKAFAAMATGFTAELALNANFFGGVSRVLGVVRTTSGGTVGTSTQFVISTPVSAAAGTPLARLYSQNAADTSVYTLYWVNEIAPTGSTMILC